MSNFERGTKVKIKDLKIGEGRYEVDAIMMGEDRHQKDHCLVQFEEHLLLVKKDRLLFENDDD